MNSIFNKIKLPAWLGILAIIAMALGSTGCTDHGPVGIYSQELFGQSRALPHMDLSSTSQLTFTVQTGGTGNSLSSPFGGFFVYLVNDGGSSTYGPIVVNFYVASNPQYINLVTSYNQATAIGDDGIGQEVPNNGSILTLERGYILNGTPTVSDVTCSLQFWCPLPNNDNSATFTPVQIDISITDGLGNVSTNQFYVYINT